MSCLWLGFFLHQDSSSRGWSWDAHPWVGTMLAPQQVGKTAHPIVLRHQGAEELLWACLKKHRFPEPIPGGFWHWCLNFPTATLGRERAHADSVHNASHPRRSLLTISKDLILPLPPVSACSAARKPTPLRIHSHMSSTSRPPRIAYCAVPRHSLLSTLLLIVLTAHLVVSASRGQAAPKDFNHCRQECSPSTTQLVCEVTLFVLGLDIQDIPEVIRPMLVWPLSTKAVSSHLSFSISWGWFFPVQTPAVYMVSFFVFCHVAWH